MVLLWAQPQSSFLCRPLQISMGFVLNKFFGGKPVAQLPFTPMFPFTIPCHIRLENPKPNDCRCQGTAASQ
jgi:hypothetical protein